MLAIYQINVQDYGTYVSSSDEPEIAMQKQMNFLYSEMHHHTLLQHLYNLFPKNFSTEIVMYIPDISLLNLLKQMYRSNLPCCLDSPYRSEELNNRYMLHKFKPPIFITVDEYNIARVYNEKSQFLSYEVAPLGFVTGWYNITNGKTIRRIKRDSILGLR